MVASRIQYGMSPSYGRHLATSFALQSCGGSPFASIAPTQQHHSYPPLALITPAPISICLVAWFNAFTLVCNWTTWIYSCSLIDACFVSTISFEVQAHCSLLPITIAYSDFLCSCYTVANPAGSNPFCHNCCKRSSSPMFSFEKPHGYHNYLQNIQFQDCY